MHYPAKFTHKVLRSRNPINAAATGLFFSTLVGLAFLPTTRAVSPMPSQGYPLQLVPDQATCIRVSDRYGQIPLSFEANEGQQAEQVKFLSRGKGYNLFLTNGEAVLALRKPNKKTKAPAEQSAAFSEKGKSQLAIVRTNLVGAKPSPKVTGQKELPGKANYFIGNDPTKWRTDVTTYGKVHYEQVYPGIDLIYYGNQHQLEYDFVVAPGADPARIRLNITGARKMYVNSRGQLVLQTASGPLRWNKPAIYQEIDGKRCAVKGKYLLRRGRQLSFRVAAYDALKPLIIDPALVYSTYLGGSNTDLGQAIAIDTAGDAYVTGVTLSTNFPTTGGTAQTAYGGGTGDAFVTKLNSAGNGLVYSTYLGGSGGVGGSDGDNSFGIAVDASGNAYITGYTSSTDFPTTVGAFHRTYGGSGDAFVTMLNSTGSGLMYSTYLGGSDGEQGNGIAVDGGGNAYVTGFTRSANFPTTLVAFETTPGGMEDAFVTKLNPTGTGLIYSTYLGGSSNDEGFGIAVDAAGNAYVTGFTGSTNFPTMAGAFQTTFGGVEDAFVTKLNFAGTGLIYSTYLGGSSNDEGFGIAVDAAGNAFVTGRTSSINFPTMAGGYQTTFGGSADAFVTKLDSTGIGLVYSTYLGGNNLDGAVGIAVNAAGNAYVTGFTGSTNFPTTPGAFQTTFGGVQDVFMTILDSAGAGLLYSTYLGGSAFDKGYGLAVDTVGNAYIGGSTESTNFPTTAGTYQTGYGGTSDAFVAKINPAASPTPPPTPTPSPTPGTTSSTASFNNTPISSSNYIWFTGVLKPSGLGTHAVTFTFTQQTITSANFTLSVPDATVTFDPAAILATTTFTGGMWVTRVPLSGLAGNTFLSALSYSVPANLPGGIHNVTWSGMFTSDTPGTSLQWKWAAAVYQNFSSDYTSLGVKPVDDNVASQYKNSDHAGTPENFKSHVIGGARGGGGSNYTGGYSGTVNVGPF